METVDKDIYEQIQVYLPKYLTPAQKVDLYTELKAFPNFSSYYLGNRDPGDLLQGDGWRGFVAINFNTHEAKECSGVVISNSCDISATNDRYRGRNVLFAPLVGLESFIEKVREIRNAEQIEAILKDIREQRLTDVFYYPENENIPESVIFLDDIRPHPLSNFIESEKEKLFAINQQFFYLFLLKLSIHFSRFQEDVVRSEA